MIEETSDQDRHVREVYPRFGLAIHHAQVLEHGLVNCLAMLELIPSRRDLAHSQAEWRAAVDAFFDRRFEASMGRLMMALREVTSIPTDLEGLLREALQRRNWLAHDFFRERAAEFGTPSGREQMLLEVDACRAVFEAADSRLDGITRPLRLSAGITDELMDREYRRMYGAVRKHDG